MAKSIKTFLSDKEFEKFIKKDDQWRAIEVEITGTNGEVYTTSMCATTVKLFMLEMKVEEGTFTLSDLEEYGQIKYEEGYDCRFAEVSKVINNC